MRLFTPREIRRLRLALRMTADQFAQATGVTRDAVFKWQAGVRRPNYNNIAALNKLAKTLERRETVSA